MKACSEIGVRAELALGTETWTLAGVLGGPWALTLASVPGFRDGTEG